MTDKEKIIAEIERLMNWKPKAIPSGMRQRDVLNIRKGVLLTLKAFINSLPDEQQPSEDLEKAAKEYVKENCILPEYCNDGDNPYYEECTATVFKDGAQWQKEQMMKSAIDECYITRNKYTKENVLNGLSVTCDAIQKFKDGDKVKVIIVKEDEQ